MEEPKNLEQLPSERQQADHILTAFLEGAESMSVDDVDRVLGNLEMIRAENAGTTPEVTDTPARGKNYGSVDEQLENNLQEELPPVDELKWSDIAPDASTREADLDEFLNPIDTTSDIGLYQGDLGFLDNDDFTVPETGDNLIIIAEDDNDAGLYQGDLGFLDNDDFIIPTEGQLEDELIERRVNVDIDKARNKLAELSVKLRGKHTKRFNNKKLSQDYDSALDTYSKLLKNKAKLAILNLKSEGLSEKEIKQLSAVSITKDVIEERNAFTKAELEAYMKLNPKVGRLAKRWSEYGLVKKVVIGGAAGFTATAMLPAAFAITGVGASVLAAGALSAKTAKTIGMYKLNKNSKHIKEFDKKADQDELYAKLFIAQSTTDTESQDNQFDALADHTSNAMASSIDLRIEHDQRSNKKRLAVVVGGIATGAVLGMITNHLWDNRHGSGSSGKSVGRQEASDVKPQADTHGGTAGGTDTGTGSHNPTTGTGDPNSSLQPDAKDHIPVKPDQTGAGGSMEPDYIPGSTSEPTPEIPTEPVVPTEEVVQIPDFGLNRTSWDVAHDFAPGHESAFMQRGIDMYNQANGTNFALTPHNGSTWIMDGNLSINPMQMEEMNRLMVIGFADELENAA